MNMKTNLKTNTRENIIQICFTQNQREMLEKRSKEYGVSIGSIVRVAVMNYFNNLEQG